MASETASLQSARRDGVLDPAPAGFLAGILAVPVPEDVLPPMWHTVYLLDRWARAELGPDGHPLHGLPTPPSEPHRRMFAGGRAVHHRLLRLGAPVSRTSTVISTVQKEGRSGRLTFVTVRHEYAQDGETAVVDEQDIVYRPFDSGASASSAPPAEAEAIEGETRFEVDPVTLHLFSTATANAHRIHYDVEYARTEGHPGLVVHGPLQVLLMAGALAAQGADLVCRELDYRLLAPAWGAQTLRVGVPASGDASVVVLDAGGRRIARTALGS
jgi:3-methylfumaryl-CoA hydratase